MTTTQKSRSADLAWRARAARVIPGGMYGHQRASLFPSNYPQFLVRGEGALVQDADGREFVDLMCGYGPIVLGYQHPAVEEAASRQRAQGDCQNLPSPRMVELAEVLVDTVDHADWAYMAKNGTDATTTSLTIARAATGRTKVLMAEGSYHGAAPWCTPGTVGVCPQDRANIITFEYNDVASFDAAVTYAGDDFAAVIVTPFKHNDGEDQELPSGDFLAALRRRCDEQGAVLILDDVRAGFRLNIGDSWAQWGVSPDLSVWGKAISNGYAVSAILGTDALEDAATRIFSTGTFWFAAVPMAAALATIQTLRTEDGVATMERAGGRLRDEMLGQASELGLRVHHSGPAQMPYLTFAGDDELAQMHVFAEVALDHGLYLHPRHNWFVGTAHTDAIIDRALEATHAAFRAVARRTGLEN